jgi:thioredoxin reductase (NADPH)
MTGGRGTALPVLFVVDGDRAVLDALTRALGRRFGADYRVLGERTAAAALASLALLAARSEEVALVVAAERVADTEGVELLARACELHPGAKRVLLVERGNFTSANPVVRAMILGQADYHLARPWEPVEQSLYPAVGEFLAAWDKGRAGAYQLVRVVGPRWAVRCHELRDLLSRVGVPYGFYADDSEEGRRLLAEAGQAGARVPVLAFADGRVLVDPVDAELAEALGGRTRPEVGTCEVAVIGAGPAGLTAAVYGASEGLRTMVLEPQVPGGQAGTSSRIRNYPGFPRGISGEELAYRTFEQAWLFGADFVFAQAATGLGVRGDERLVRLSDGSEVAARAVVVATGAAWRRLRVPGLEALHGAGVFYGAAGAEARALQGAAVFVVGAGNSAGQTALHLARYAASVTIVAIEDHLGEHMSDYLVQELGRTPNVAVRLRTEVVDGHGRARLEGLTLRERGSGATSAVPAAALFVLIGAEPRTAWLDGTVERDERGYLLTGRDLLRAGTPPPGWPVDRPPLHLETSVPGVFAAGDVRYRSVKRVASAVGDGATAVQLVHEYLAEQDARPLVAGRRGLGSPPAALPAPGLRRSS